MDLQKIIKFYEEHREEYKERYDKIEKQFKTEHFNAEEAYYMAEELKEYRLIVSMINAFLIKLKQLEADK